MVPVGALAADEPWGGVWHMEGSVGVGEAWQAWTLEFRVAMIAQDSLWSVCAAFVAV